MMVLKVCVLVLFLVGVTTANMRMPEIRGVWKVEYLEECPRLSPIAHPAVPTRKPVNWQPICRLNHIGSHGKGNTRKYLAIITPIGNSVPHPMMFRTPCTYVDAVINITGILHSELYKQNTNSISFKIICLSSIEHFLISHLKNVYMQVGMRVLIKLDVIFVPPHISISTYLLEIKI
uniref:Protease inhibitor n=2 Tax=Cajanus cajan TaxID=3821 RepID=Q5U9N0_CAJCA|nr:protease inhibitor [Cajanus cajan]